MGQTPPTDLSKIKPQTHRYFAKYIARTIKIRMNLTELSEYLPERVTAMWLKCNQDNKSFYRVVWRDHTFHFICRTDVQPLMWLWWWSYYRLIAVLELTCLIWVHLLEIFDLRKFEPGEIMSNIFFERWRYSLTKEIDYNEWYCFYDELKTDLTDKKTKI